MREGYILAAAVLYGLIGVGCRFFSGMGFSLYEILFYTFVSGSLVTGAFLVFKPEYRIKKDMFSFFLLYGLIGAFLQLTSFGAIVLDVPVAVAVLLLYTEPAWTVFLARPFLGEKITNRKLAAVAFSILGVFVVAWGDGFFGLSFWGLVLAVSSGFFLSLWVIYARKSDLHKQHYMTSTFASMFFPLPWFVLSYPLVAWLAPDPLLTAFSQPLSPFILLFFLYVLAAQATPNFLLYSALEFVSASRAGIVMPLEPVAAAVFAFLFFQEPVTVNIAGGGALILFANYVASEKRG